MNIVLADNNDRLESQAEKAEATEAKFNDLAKNGGTTARKLLKIVKLNSLISKEKRQLVKADIMQSLLSTVLMSENDESSIFDDHEITRLVRFLNGLPSIKFNEELLIKRVTENPSLSAVLDLCQDIERDDIPPEQRIFTVFEDKHVPTDA